MKPSNKSAVEIEMEQMIKECSDIVDDSYLTTNDARKLIGLLAKGLAKCEELRISRDNKISKQEAQKLMIKSFKMGQEKYLASGYPIKLWVADEIKLIIWQKQ
jgi:hypothetical protein